LERVETGPICLERDFDLKILTPKLQELIKQYEIQFDRNHIIPDDNSLADDLWKAGLELFLETGVLCTSTHRRILFTQDEINEAMKNFPGEYRVGFGKDSRLMSARKIEDQKRPFCFFSPDITCSEELFVPMSMAYLQEPIADGVCAPILEEVEGIRIRTGGPFEVKGSVAHTMMFREAARRVGRPGLLLQSVGTAESDAAQIAASNPEWGERLTDSRFVGTISELKTNFSLLNKMIHFNTYGCFIGNLTGPIMGGFSGGTEGTAIVGVASHLQGLMVNQAHYHNYFPFQLNLTCNTNRELLWVFSTTYQALARNSPFISMSGGFAAAGPCTSMVLLEAAAHGLTSVVSGANLWEMAVAKNKYKDRATPMEARMACEVGCSVASMGLKRKDANDMALDLVKKYEERISNPPLGKKFQECYDPKKIVPTNEYKELFKQVKKDVEAIGIEFEY